MAQGPNFGSGPYVMRYLWYLSEASHNPEKPLCICEKYQILPYISNTDVGLKSEVLDWDFFSTLGLNPRPIIGVLAQGLPHSLVDVFAESNKTTYIGAAYVKYLESAGARVVSVLLDQVCILSTYFLNASLKRTIIILI